MLLRIFTLPFDPVVESFPDEIVTEFCLNKRVHKLESQFFQQEGKAYWSVSVHYDIVAKGEDKTRALLDENEKVLYERLREWRKETAHADGIPVYLISNNKQFVEIIQRKVKTLEGLKAIKGFGRKKIENYGRRILALLNAYYDEKKKTEPPVAQEEPF